MTKRHMKSMTLLGSVVLLLTSCGGNSQQQQQQAPAPQLAVITVGETNSSLESGYPATLHGSNDVEIRPQISGFLTKVCVQEGQKVSAGQTLFEIDRVQLDAAVNAAQAAVNVAQANVNTAQTNADNDKILVDKGIIAQPAYQTSLNSLAAAKSQLAQAQANLVSARKNLSYASVRAPKAGVVGTIDYKEGALVSPSSALTILSSNSEMEAYFSMNEKEILKLTDNGTRSMAEAIKQMPDVYLKLANGERYPEPGRIISISGVLDSRTGSATVKAAFPNPNGMLHSGNTGQVLIPTVERDVMVIPQKATYEVQDMKFVYVVGDSAKVQSRPIEVSNINDGQTYIVTSGLKAGDVVVVEGIGSTLQPGMDGTVINPKK